MPIKAIDIRFLVAPAYSSVFKYAINWLVRQKQIWIMFFNDSMIALSPVPTSNFYMYCSYGVMAMHITKLLFSD